MLRGSKTLRFVLTLAAAALVTGLIFVGCGIEPLQSTAEVDALVWTLSGMVSDTNNTGTTAIEGATVSTPNDGKTVEVKTDASGFYQINGLTPGQHKVLFSCSSYATMYAVVSDSGDSVFNVYKDKDFNVAMYKLDATLKGTVHALLNDGSGRAVAGSCKVQVLPQPPTGMAFLTKVYETTADENGAFSFSDLPRTNVLIRILDWTNSDGVVYQFTAIPRNLAVVSSVGPQDMTVRPDYIVRRMSTNIAQGYFNGDAITVTFSDSVDAKDVVVKLNNNNLNITTSWSDDGKTLTVTPILKIPQSLLCSLEVNGVSANKKTISENIKFTTSLAPYITWSNVMDAAGNGKCCVSRTDTIRIAVSESLYYVCIDTVDYDSIGVEISLSANGDTIYIVPVTPLTANNWLTVLQMTGKIKAYSGVTGLQVRFTVPAFTLLPLGYPVIVSGNVLDGNLNGRRNVPINTAISITVDKVLSTIDPVTGYDVKLDSTGKVITIRSLTQMATGTSINITVTGRTSEGKNYSITIPAFTTAAAPQMLWTNLRDANGSPAVQIGVSDSLVFVFSEAIDELKTITVTWVGTSIEYRTVVRAETLVVYPTQPLDAGTTPTIAITATSVTDQAISMPAMTINVVRGIEIVSSSIVGTGGDTLRTVRVGDSIVVKFSVPVDTAEFDYRSWIVLVEVNTGDTVKYSVVWSDSNRVVTLTPAASLLPREESTSGYTLFVNTSLTSIYPNDGLAGTYRKGFYTVFRYGIPGKVSNFRPDSARALLTYLPVAGNLVVAQGFQVRWDQSDTVDTYHILVRGTVRGTMHWRQIAVVNNTYKSGNHFQSYNITEASLDNLFDIPGPGVGGGGTQLVNNNHIRVVVVGQNGAGRGTALSDEVVIQDDEAVNTNNQVTVAYDGATWNNTLTTTVTRTITITFPEWMDVTTSPTISYTDGGDAATATAAASAWEWTSMTVGRFVVTVPASTDWSADTPVIDIENCKDSSGNASGSSTYTDDIALAETLGATP